MSSSSEHIEFYSVCRLCLKQDSNLLQLFHISDNLEYKLYKFCNIRVSIEDRLPPQICPPCVEKVNKCYRFKIQCERSDAFLRDYFEVETPTDETDSNFADEGQSCCFTRDFCCCKAENSANTDVEQDEEDIVGDGEVKIVYSSTPLSTTVEKSEESISSITAVHKSGADDSTSMEMQHKLSKQEDGFRGWPCASTSNDHDEPAESYETCLKKLCKELEEDLNQSIMEQLQEQALSVKLLPGMKTRLATGQMPDGVTVQQKKFKQTPKKKPEEPQRDYFTRKSWSTLQAKQVQFNNEMLKPEHLLLNLGLRPQPDACVHSPEPPIENTCSGLATLGPVTFKTEESSNVEVENMDTETRDDSETMNLYEGIDTKHEPLTESVSNFYEAEPETRHISIEEYSINESIDIKEEEDDGFSDGTIIEYSSSESENLNDDVQEVPSEKVVKIVEETPEGDVWHWISNRYNKDVPNNNKGTGVGDLYQRLTEKNSLMMVVNKNSEPSPPITQLNGYHPEEKACYEVRTVCDENDSPSSEEIIVIVSDVEDTVEDTSTELHEETQKVIALETTSSENNSSKGHKCELCGKIFMVLSNWVSHQKKHESNALYSCNKCRKTYEQEDLLNKHIDWVHTTQQLKCTECSVIVHTKRGLQRHMNRHKGVRSHRCNLCHRSFFTSGELQSHFEAHLPKQCGICNKIFSHKASLKAHVELHAGIGHKCTICDKIFSRKLYLNRHLQYHSKSSACRCDKCDMSFLDSKSLLLHKASAHNSE